MSGSAEKKPPGQGVPTQREMTYLESDEEIRQAIEARDARRTTKFKWLFRFWAKTLTNTVPPRDDRAG
jgi:hypothetical protein